MCLNSYIIPEQCFGRTFPMKEEDYYPGVDTGFRKKKGGGGGGPGNC